MLTNRIPADVVGVDPTSTPEGVDLTRTFVIPESLPNTNSPVQRLFIGADGGAPTVQIYGVEELLAAGGFVLKGTVAADRTWFTMSGALPLTNNALLPLADQAGNPEQFPPGRYYVRVTVAAPNTDVVIAFA